jgi:hypothetical protein
MTEFRVKAKLNNNNNNNNIITAAIKQENRICVPTRESQ